MTLELVSLEWVHPGLLLILGAWVMPLLKGRIKRVAMVLLPAAALALCVRLSMMPNTYDLSFLGKNVPFVLRVDALSLVFSYVFSIIAHAPQDTTGRLTMRISQLLKILVRRLDGDK